MAATHRNKELRNEKERTARIKDNKNRPDHEVTIGIIDSIHTLSYLLKDRDLTHPDVLAAIDDLYENSLGLPRLVNQFIQKLKNQ